MALVPEKQLERIQFYEAHIEPWLANAAALGISADAVAELQSMAAEARAALGQQAEAQQVARAATLRVHLALEALSTAGANLIRQIRTTAAVGGNEIYALAHIPPTAARSPMGALGTPHSFTVVLDAIGALTLKWKCDQPRGAVGTMYQVWRAIGEDGEMKYLGGSGVKWFVDDTVPAGAAQMTYQVQAVRSTSKGPVARHVVFLATVGGLKSFTAKGAERAAA